MYRRYMIIGSLFGATGIGLGAAAAHLAGGGALQNASVIMLVHAAVLVSLALHGRTTNSLRIGAGLLAFGTTLFVADITLRAFTQEPLFARAAPVGGGTMIAGWLFLAMAAFNKSSDA